MQDTRPPTVNTPDTGEDQSNYRADCHLHDGIPAHAQCCVFAGHEPPCVPVAAHVIFGPGAVVVTLASNREARRSKQRHALAIGASTLDSLGLERDAQLLRARIAAMRCDLPPMVGQSYATESLDDTLERAIADSSSTSDAATMAAQVVFGPAAVVITMPGELDALRAEQRGALAFSARVLEAFGHDEGARALRATPTPGRARTASGTGPVGPREDFEDDDETRIFEVPLAKPYPR